jgi:hypothetical protein
MTNFVVHCYASRVNWRCLVAASNNGRSPSCMGTERFLVPVTSFSQRLNPSSSLTNCNSQNGSYFTTGGLAPISSSWGQAPWDLGPEFLFCNWTLAVIILLEHPLWRENLSVVYSCCWSSPALSFSDPRLFQPGGSGAGWPCYNPTNCVPFSSPATTRRVTVKVFEPASTRDAL